MGISSNTPSNLQLGVGDFYFNDISLGATGQEGSFEVEQELYAPALGGAKGDIAGTVTIIRETARLVTTLKEWTIAQLTLMIPGLACSSDASSDYTTTPNIGLIASGSHHTAKWVGELASGDDVQIDLYNALPQPGISWTVSDTGEWGAETTWQAYYTAALPKQRPWKVFIEN